MITIQIKHFKKCVRVKERACEVMILHPGYIDDELLSTSSLIFQE